MTLQPAAVLPPDVELWGTGYLRAFLAARPEPYASGVIVSNAKPGANAPRIVAIRRDGGPIQGIFDFPRLTIRVWADDADAGADLARLVVAALNVSPGNGPVVAVESIFGPSPVPDSSQTQYMVNAELKLRCTVL